MSELTVPEKWMPEYGMQTQAGVDGDHRRIPYSTLMLASF
jgi:hypothetical protein